MKKKNLIIFFCIIAVIYFGVSFALFVSNNLDDIRLFESTMVLEKTPEIILVVLSFIFQYIISNALGIVGFIAIFVSLKSFKKDKLSRADFEKNTDYYRDIIDGYSPAELSYIDDFKLDEQKDVVATLLSLKQKNKIEFKDNDIAVLENDMKLSNNEMYILSCIQEGKVKNLDINMFINETKKDCYENKIMENGFSDSFGKRVFKIVKIVFLIIFVFFILMLLSMFNVAMKSNIITISVIICGIIMAISTVIVATFLPIYIFTYVIKLLLNPERRTKKGEEINQKLEGLKLFLKDFSLIDETESDSIKLWDEYLIYSVIFRQNYGVIKDICKTYICS